MAKLGEDVLGDMAGLGLDELRAAVTGQEQPPVQQAEAPVTEQDAAPSYADALAQQASLSEGRGESRDLGISR